MNRIYGDGDIDRDHLIILSTSKEGLGYSTYKFAYELGMNNILCTMYIEDESHETQLISYHSDETREKNPPARPHPHLKLASPASSSPPSAPEENIIQHIPTSSV